MRVKWIGRRLRLPISNYRQLSSPVETVVQQKQAIELLEDALQRRLLDASPRPLSDHCDEENMPPSWLDLVRNGPRTDSVGHVR